MVNKIFVRSVVKPLLCALSAPLLLTSHVAVIAQQDSLVLEEMIVTSQRREESLQEVPISVTAFSSDLLEKSNVKAAEDYLAMTPNVGFSEDGEGGSRNINISIRGVSNINLDGIATANSIGYYIDELSVGSVAQGTINPQLQDMERIEVLRGPQGTYYGRNAVGGALNITTKKPDAELYFEGSLSAGSFGSKGVEGIINLPLSETFMARAVLAYEDSDTAIENVNASGNDPYYDYATGRLSLRWLPSDVATFDLSITRTVENEGGDISVPSGVVDLDTQSIFETSDANDSGKLGFYPANDNRIDRDTIELNDKEFTIINARLALDFEAMTLKSITGWLDSAFDRESDLDGIAATFGPLPLRRVNGYEGTSYSQEFRLQSSGDSSVDWTLGVFYAKDVIDQTNQIQRLPDTQPSGTPAGFINNNIRDFDTESTALFGEGTWHLSDEFDLTLGARYSRDKVFASELDLREGRDESSGRDASSPLSDEVSFNDLSPKLVLRYIPSDDFTLYGSLSKGYKAGGTDVTGRSRTAGAKYEPEDLINTEIGFKARLANGRVSISGAVFALKWQDFQVQTNRLEDPNDIGSAIETTQNAEKASSEGIELELVSLLSDALTWSFNLGYINAQFDDYPNAVLKGNTNDRRNVINLSGQPLPRTPDLTMSTALDYGFFVGELDGYARAEWSYTDETVSDIEAVGSLVGVTVNGDPFNLPEFPYQIDAYSVINLSAGVEGENFGVSGFIKNALDKQYYNGTSDNFGAAGIRLRPHFREYGIKLTYKM